MAELLIWAMSPPSTGNVYIDAQMHHSGDVIKVEPDGHPWSIEERTKPGWWVVPVPGISTEVFTGLVDSDPMLIGDPPAMNPRWRLRTHRINLAVLAALRSDPIAWTALVAEGTREAAYAAGVIVVIDELP